MVGAGSPASGTPARPPLVLLADGAPDTRELYRFCLTHSGYRVEEAADGREAVTKARQLLPRIVVTDVRLPLVDGFSVCRQLKQDQRTKDIPVIAVTGYAGPGSREQAREAGFDAFLLKPVPPDDLLSQVRQSLLAVGGACSHPCESRSGS